MQKDMQKSISASPAQLAYANLLNYGAIFGFVVMLVTFALYVSGIMEPQIPLDQLTSVWALSAAEYRAIGNIPQGWGWASMLDKGDMCNFIGIAILAGLTIVCYAQLVWNFIKKNNKIMCAIAFLEVLVLSLAASGILVSGGH